MDPVPAEVTADGSVVRALYFLVFLTGGWAMWRRWSSVAGRRGTQPDTGFGCPRLWRGPGLVIAAIAEVTALVLVWPPLMVLLPVARIPAFVWLIIACVIPAHCSVGVRSLPDLVLNFDAVQIGADLDASVEHRRRLGAPVALLTRRDRRT